MAIKKLNLFSILAVLSLTTFLFGFGSFHFLSESELALSEFEESIEKFDSNQSFNHNKIAAIKTQQYDFQAKEVLPESNLDLYSSTVKDIFYGYQIFILVDKSKSDQPSKYRDPKTRAAQTMYVFKRNSNNQIELLNAFPVSTGKEPSPNVSDTREGFMRIQNSQAKYVSKKYGEAMPFSLWFESEYGTAIHQTLQYRCDNLIGKRASAGCIRLCPGDSENVFSLVTSLSRNSAIVLLDKRTGIPIKQETSDIKSLVSSSTVMSSPKVILGYPVFVRIIDGNSPEKIKEIEKLIENPTEEFKKYFLPVSEDVLWSFKS